VAPTAVQNWGKEVDAAARGLEAAAISSLGLDRTFPADIVVVIKLVYRTHHPSV